MADINTQIANIGAQLGITLKWGLIVLALLAVLGGVAWWSWQRKQWNIRVEFKLLRGEGKAVFSEWGKGSYKPSRGYAIVKRPGLMGPKYEIKNFDPTVYLQGNDVLTVRQIGANEMMPVVPESFIDVIDEKTGQVAVLMHLKGDTTKDRAWAAMRSRDLLNAFTIRSFLKDNAAFLGFGLVLIVLIVGLFLGFGMILDRLPKAAMWMVLT